MKNPLRNCRKPPIRKLTPEDVIRSVLKQAYDVHPAHLMPTAVIVALADAGFAVMSGDEVENEIALAFQAGVDSVTQA